MKTIKTIPYKLNTTAMILRLNRKNENDRIFSIRSLFFLKENGVIPVTDLIKILKACKMHEIFWKFHTLDIKTEEGIFLYGNLLSLCEKCGTLKIDSDLRYMVNQQLDDIYKRLQ